MNELHNYCESMTTVVARDTLVPAIPQCTGLVWKFSVGFLFMCTPMAVEE